MRILAIETVGATGSVATLDDARVLVECPLDAQSRSAHVARPRLECRIEGLKRSGRVALCQRRLSQAKVGD